MTAKRARLLVLVAAASLTLVFFVHVCDLLYDCGCRSLWNGAAAHCNIHRDLPPHCPWCAHPFSAGAPAFVAAVGAQAAIVLASPSAIGLLGRALLALAAFPVASGLAGFVAGLVVRYWG